MLDWTLAAAAMAVGGWIRWSGFRRQSLWVDEMSSYGLALQPLRRIAPNILAVDAHPPGYIYLVHFAHYTFHLGIVGSVRAPSLIAGTVTVAVVYALARILVGRGAAILAAALAVLSPMLVWYSREGRMYAVTWLLVMLTLLCLALAVRRRQWPWLIPYAVCLGASLYADISAIMVLLPQAFLIPAFLFRSRNGDRRLGLQVAAAYATGWALFLPWLLNLHRQVGLTRGTFAGYPPTLGTAWRLVLNITGLDASYAQLFSLNVPLILGALILIASVAAIGGAVWLGADHRLFAAIVLTLTVGPAAMCALLVAVGSPSVLIPRVMGLAAFGIILALAGTAELGRRAARGRSPWLGVVVAGISVALATSALSFATVEAHGYNSQNWRPAAQMLAARAQPDDALIYYPFGLKYMVDAYLPAGSPWPANGVGIWQAPNPVAQSWFGTWARGHPHVFFVFYAATGIDAPLQDAWFQSHGYRRIWGDPSAGYGVLEYAPTSAS